MALLEYSDLGRKSVSGGNLLIGSGGGTGGGGIGVAY
jgi:hypothetical protein